ncbi:MAG TPA: sigma factor [Polyangiaceae bacterium]|jgi:RNA polymerase sigma-70 factor (ECF subfamily)|nr:sigma factor [Polyangiaceae bacterium]
MTQFGELDALMARLADGDRSVFGTVFDLIWTPVRRFCTGLLAQEADAEDAAQEAMQKVLERASQYDRKRAAMPWILSIAAWECRTILRKRTRRRESNELPEQTAGDHAEDDLVNRNLIAAAVLALGELSELDREALVAAFWDESLAKSSNATFRKRKERALGRLRETFRRLYGLD